MSKLFEALQIIEQQSTPEPFTPGNNLAKKQSTRPFNTILLILIFLFVTGGVVLYSLDLHTGTFFRGDTSVPHLQENMVQSSVKQKETKKTEIKTSLSDTDNFHEPYNPSKIQINPVEVKKQQPTTTSHQKIIKSLPEKLKVPVSQVGSVTQQLQKQQNELKKTVQQLLYQAEERRKEGDMEAAVILYRRAWKLEKSPETANNLAAGLITMKNFNDAYKLLQKALAMAPDDQDIQYNIKILNKYLTERK
ncbi:hypothetical protein DGMP_22100 [Desulfomarina profundi]|uniref:Tetratricopeptide repeat protein n=1 Tax=Desulfomarina profundi TaxID=2772557 RepID=A0A8D5FX15_9BACT|nr:tetratricopeptide repeat protein [Desulfomarina profundi]BCL61517.1 hypothetical protein DGMP_22100 [Desulfomarina profundi]